MKEIDPTARVLAMLSARAGRKADSDPAQLDRLERVLLHSIGRGQLIVGIITLVLDRARAEGRRRGRQTGSRGAQRALAQYAKRDEQIRTLGNLVQKLVG